MVDPPIVEKKICYRISSKNDQLSRGRTRRHGWSRSLAIKFLDNGGGVSDKLAIIIKVNEIETSSDNPDKTIISLKNDETSYKVYIAVQNELVATYNDLRNREFERLYPNLGVNFVEAKTIRRPENESWYLSWNQVGSS